MPDPVERECRTSDSCASFFHSLPLALPFRDRFVSRPVASGVGNFETGIVDMICGVNWLLDVSEKGVMTLKKVYLSKSSAVIFMVRPGIRYPAAEDHPNTR
jgi:hypothetical protein